MSLIYGQKTLSPVICYNLSQCHILVAISLVATSFSGQFSGGLFCTSKDFVQGGAPRLSSWGVTGPLQSPYLDILDFQDPGRQDICNIWDGLARHLG